MKYVLDAHIFAWHILDYWEKLSESIREILYIKFPKGEVTLIVPIIVLAELEHLLHRKPEYGNKFQFKFCLTFQEFIQYLTMINNLAIYPINIQVIKTMSKIPINEVPEIHDRLIIAMAIVNKSVLITYDRKILGYCKRCNIQYIIFNYEVSNRIQVIKELSKS